MEKASGVKPQGLPGFAKLLNVQLDMKVKRVGRFPTIGSFLGSRVHGVYPYGGLRLSHGHKIHDSLGYGHRALTLVQL